MKRFYIVATLIICLMAQKPVSVSANTAHCGNITANEVWGNTGNVHMVTCDVDINSGVTLIIYENTMIKFESGHKLIVNGTLHVSGNSSQPIYFTSIRDDTVGGDTNADGGASTPNWDNWRGIEFRDSSDDAASLIDHVIIRFAGGDYRGSVNLDNASPTLSHSTFPNSYHGIYINSSTPILVCNNIQNNIGYGLFNNTTAILAQAQNQWWGSASGPYHPDTNPGGTGNQVTDGVNYNPWSTSPCE